MNGGGPRRAHLRRVLSLPERGHALECLLRPPRDHQTVGQGGSIPLGRITRPPLSSQRWRGWRHWQHVCSQYRRRRKYPHTRDSSQSATMGPGSPLPTPLPLRGSRTPALECPSLPGEERHQTPGLRPQTSLAQTRNCIGTLPSPSPPSIAIAGLEPPGNSLCNACHRLRRSQSGS